MEIYKSQKEISKRSKQSLIYDLKNYLEKTKCIISSTDCSGLFISRKFSPRE